MTQELLIWVNGKCATSLPLPDRGLNYGDGLFETLLVESGTPLFLERHIARLNHGLEILFFPDCADTVRAQILQVAEQLRGVLWAALRVTVTRGEGPRGYAPPENMNLNVVIEVSRLDRDCAVPSPAVRLGVAKIPLSGQPCLAGIKHLNRLEQVVAARQLKSEGYEEGLMLDTHGRVVSLVAGNLFLFTQGKLITPSLKYCGVAGTRRALVLDALAPQLKMPVEEADVCLDDLGYADEVFCTNSLHGIRSVHSLGGSVWQSTQVAESLFSLYREALA